MIVAGLDLLIRSISAGPAAVEKLERGGRFATALFWWFSPGDRPPETLTRPPPHLLKRFHLGQVCDNTIQRLLAEGFSLAIC